MKGLGQGWAGGVMSQGTHLHSHGLPRAVDFDASLVHGAQVHQHRLVILIQKYIGGLEVPVGMDVPEHPLGPLTIPMAGADGPPPVRIALAVNGLQPTADAAEDEEDPLLWHEGPFLSQCLHLAPEGPALANTSSKLPLPLLVARG